MKRFIVAAMAAIFLGGAASAATVDLTDPMVTVTPSAIANNPLVATESADGVTFTLTALSASGTTRLVQSYFGGVPTSGLRFGTPGNGMFSFKLETDTKVSLDSFFSTGTTLTTALIDIALNGSVISAGNALNGGTDPFASGPLMLDVGDAFVFSLTNNSVLTTGSLDGFSFTKVTGVVPLPAGLPLLLTGFAGFAFLRRRRS